jgi:tRNA dimethylallyltransferase
MNQGPAVAIVGATATGKSALALTLAEAVSGEIVSVDSRLLYRGMDIGTAKPTPAERSRAPHHLIDVADPDETWSLTRYQQAVYAVVPEIFARGNVPLLVGGTGQYMRAVLDGWKPPTQSFNPAIRARLEAEAQAGRGVELVRRLELVDPASAARIDPRNVRRVIRALEVYETSGAPASAQSGRQPPPFPSIQLGLALPRPDLYQRIDRRIDSMIAAGLVDEVRGLLARGYGRGLPSMSAIGYGEIAAHLAGEIDLAEAVQRMRSATRKFVRHQANWFRETDPAIRWFLPEVGYEGGVVEWVRQLLAANPHPDNRSPDGEC